MQHRYGVLITILIIGVLAVTSAACRKQSASDYPEDAPAAKLTGTLTQTNDEGYSPAVGDWLLVHLPAEPPHLNPLTSSDAYATELMGHIFSTLLYRDPETLEMLPHVAESWEESEDHLTYTFHMRQGLTFSDGVPLTAKDVKFTFDRLMDPKVDAAHARNYYKNVTGWELIDDYTIRFTCSEPYYKHLIMLGGLDIMPAHIYGEGDFNNHANNRNPIGSGPYTLESWETGQTITLARNERYWGEVVDRPAYFAKKVYKIITDSNAAFQVLQRGDLDVGTMRPEDWVRRANSENFVRDFNKFTYYRPAYSYVGWNLRRPQFQDKRVRKALAMMLDREKIRDTIYEGLSRTVDGSFMPGTPEYNEAIQPLPFDPVQAEALLTEAGWTDSDNDGILDKDGQKLSFELMLTTASIDGEKVATTYMDELRRHRVELIIRTMEWASLTERVDARNFDAVMMGWQMPPDPDPYQVWHSSQVDSGSNYIGFLNAEADALIEEARVTFDAPQRQELYKRFQEIIYDEQPCIFMFQPMSLLAVDKRVHGIQIYPFGLEQLQWWVPQELQQYP